MAAVVLAAIAVARAQMFVATGRDTLRGLPGLEVLVEPLQPELARRGLSTAAIQAGVARRLVRAGITVYASQRENPSPAKAYLYLHLNALAIPGADVDAVAIQLQVRQTVHSLVNESNIVDAMTWDAHDILGLPEGGAGDLEAGIQSFVDVFITDWTAVH
jgi:hypothetical protein